MPNTVSPFLKILIFLSIMLLSFTFFSCIVYAQENKKADATITNDPASFFFRTGQGAHGVPENTPNPEDPTRNNLDVSKGGNVLLTFGLIVTIIILLCFCFYQSKVGLTNERTLYGCAFFFACCAYGIDKNEAELTVIHHLLQTKEEQQKFLATCVTLDEEVRKRLLAKQVVESVWDDN